MHLTCFSNVKSSTLRTLELVQWVGGFTISKGGDGIRQAGVRASETLGGDVDRVCFMWVWLQGRDLFKMVRDEGRDGGW